VAHAGGTTQKTYNQQVGGGQWVLHGTYSFSAGTGGCGPNPLAPTIYSSKLDRFLGSAKVTHTLFFSVPVQSIYLDLFGSIQTPLSQGRALIFNQLGKSGFNLTDLQN
jgi:hypothetical protein